MNPVLFVACCSALVILISSTLTVTSGYWKRQNSTHKKSAYLLIGSFGAISIAFAAITPLIKKALRHPVPLYLVIGRRVFLSAIFFLFLGIFTSRKGTDSHKAIGIAAYIVILGFIAVDLLMIPCFLP